MSQSSTNKPEASLTSKTEKQLPTETSTQRQHVPNSIISPSGDSKSSAVNNQDD